MKKYSLIFGLLITVSLLLAACTGGGPADETIPPDRDTEGDVSAPFVETESPLPAESVPAGSETQAAETAKDTTPLLQGPYASSIERAEHLRGEVNAAYQFNRSEVVLSNQNCVLSYSLGGTVRGSALTTPGGRTYLSTAPDVYIRNADGTTYFLTGTGIGERMNIYRLGSYYYEVHMLDGGVRSEVTQSQDINIRPFRTGNSIGDVQYTDEGVCFTITGTSDPYINNGSTLSVDAETFNALEITLTTTDSTSAQIYLAAGPYTAITGDQAVSFRTEPDGKPHTYVIPLGEVTDYGGILCKLRLDIGSKVGETVCIHSLKAVRVESDAPAVKLDRTFHLYSDKINDVVRLVAKEDVSDLAAVGTLIRIPADAVEKLVIKDRNGLHSAPDGVDFESAEYVGFDIKNAGVYGLILLPDETSGALTVTLENGEYVIRREYIRSENTLAKGESVMSGARIYTDLNHTFDAFLATAEVERHPLTEVTTTSDADGASYVGYDVYRGAYRFNIDGVNFSQAYADPYRRFIIDAAFAGADVDYPIYVYSWTTHGNLESGALLSKDKTMLPIALEVCKNFGGEHEEPFYYEGDRAYGEIVFPMMIEAGKTTEFSIVNLYQNWGNFPLSQISSIQFIAPYYHLSTGSTETNCIAPYYVFGKDHWLLPDFRAMSAPLWSGQPQHASVGRLYFLRYTLTDGNTVGSESVENIIDAYGPTYSDIDMSYISDDGRISAAYRHLEYPQWDENRTYYTIELTVNDTIEIADFKNDFSFFSFDSRDRCFKKMGYLNEANECVVTDVNPDGTPRYLTAGDRSPYFSFFDGDETDDLTAYVNFAMIVKEATVTIGGQTVDAGFVFREKKSGNLNSVALTMDLGHVTLQKGDRFVIHLILLPWGDPSADNDQNVRDVREDSCLHPYRVSAATGTVTEDVYLPRIQAANGCAEFTLSGGADASAVRVYGFKEYTGIRVQEKINGAWVDYTLHSEGCDYDGYTVIYDGDGTFSYAFIVQMEGTDRTFRVTAD